MLAAAMGCQPLRAARQPLPTGWTRSLNPGSEAAGREAGAEDH